MEAGAADTDGRVTEGRGREGDEVEGEEEEEEEDLCSRADSRLQTLRDGGSNNLRMRSSAWTERPARRLSRPQQPAATLK